MKHIALYSILSISLSLLFVRCIPDPLEVRGIPIVKPQIVVSSQIVPDQSLVILLTKSFGALEANENSNLQDVIRQIAVNDAVVVIAGNNRTDTLIFLGNGVYGGIAIPFAPVEYSLYVNSKTLGKVTATTSVRPRINFKEIEASLYFDGFDDTLAQVTYYFEDPPGKNWYLINAVKVERNALAANALNPRSSSRLIADDEFDGKTYSERFRVSQRDLKKGDTLAVYLSNISAEYYQFIQLRLDNRFSLLEFLSEPINYPTNVNGGRGFFNLYVPDIRFFILE